MFNHAIIKTKRAENIATKVTTLLQVVWLKLCVFF